MHGSPPEWEPGAASARVIRGVLAESVLDPEESGIVERWDAAREASRVLFNRLLQARVNRAVPEGLRGRGGAAWVEGTAAAAEGAHRARGGAGVGAGEDRSRARQSEENRGRVPRGSELRRGGPRAGGEARRARRSARARERGRGRGAAHDDAPERDGGARGAAARDRPPAGCSDAPIQVFPGVPWLQATWPAGVVLPETHPAP